MAQKQKKFLAAASWIRKNPKFSILILVVFLAASFFGYRAYSIHTDKQKFEQASTSIDQLYSDIITKVGKPDAVEKNQSCGYASRKFEQGPRTCRASAQFIYLVASRGEADKKYKAIQSTSLNRKDLFKPISVSENISSNLVVSTTYTTASDKYKTKEGLICTVNYAFDTPAATFIDLETPKGTKKLYVSIGCSGDAKAEHFQVQ